MKSETLQIIFNILLLMAIISLIFTTLVIIKNVNLIKYGGYSYFMKSYNFSSCSCNLNGISYLVTNNSINQAQVNLNLKI